MKVLLTNTIIKLKIWQANKCSAKTISMFVLVLCIALNFLFLQPVLKNGLTGDDWQLLYAYKTFDPQPLNRILDVWMIRGPYTTIQFYYIGLLDEILGHNLQLFQVTNIFFKILVSMTLFFLISKIFKDYFLASISAIIFSIIHSSAGALQYVVKGTEYLALGFMNFFFVLYYYSVARGKLNLTLYASAILFMTFMLSPIRIYPLLGLIFLIEAYLVIKKNSYFLHSLQRLVIFYSPIFLISAISLRSSSKYLGDTIAFIDTIREGSWNFLLKPFDALGHGFLGEHQLQPLGLTAAVLGISLLIFSTYCFTVWNKKADKLNKLLLLFFCPFFAFSFLLGTWIILGPAFGISEPVDRYLIVPSVGISIFLSVFICYLVEKWIKSKEFIYLSSGLILFMSIAFISYYEINRHFNFFLSIGTGADEQNYMQKAVLNSFDKEQLNLIVYFDMLEQDPSLIQYHEVSSNLGYFDYWMFYFKKPSFLGCVAYITDKNKLRSGYKLFNGEHFEFDGLCAKSQYDVSEAQALYDISDFRAFRFKDKKIINITTQILGELRSKDPD